MDPNTTPKLLLNDLITPQNNQRIPTNYIRPFSDRPNLVNVEISENSIPLIDLKGIGGPDHHRLVKEIGLACRSDGFFLVKNHGIPSVLISDMLSVVKEFFRLPESDRIKFYSDDPMKPTRLSTSFNVNTEKVSNWRDFLRIHCHPLEDFVQEWPSSPLTFRPVCTEYCKHVRELALTLLKAISESLSLQPNHTEKALGRQAQHMAINYYPQCPQPELTYGLPSHKDPNAITILLQDEVAGLQVLRSGKWVSVKPVPNTFIINIGDQIEAISNGRYKSVLHRAIVNCRTERFSIPTFYAPSMDAVIEPAEILVDEENPTMYRSFTYGEYYKKFWDEGLRSKSCLDMFKNAS